MADLNNDPAPEEPVDPAPEEPQAPEAPAPEAPALVTTLEAEMAAGADAVARAEAAGTKPYPPSDPNEEIARKNMMPDPPQDAGNG